MMLTHVAIQCQQVLCMEADFCHHRRLTISLLAILTPQKELVSGVVLLNFSNARC